MHVNKERVWFKQKHTIQTIKKKGKKEIGDYL